MNTINKLIRTAHGAVSLAGLSTALILAVAGGAGSSIALGANPQPEFSIRTKLAIIYSDADENLAGQYSEIIRAIESMPSVVVVPVNLADNILYADNSRVHWQLANKVAMGGDGRIAVVYPDIGEPYRGIFSEIISGIEARTKTQVLSYAVSPGTDANALRNLLKSKDVRVVIALGRQGMRTADGLNRDFGVVVGGVVGVPEDEARDMPVISLSPDPALLFARLTSLVPDTRRVYVVYDPRQNAWLIRLAREAARNQGLELVAYEATDLKTAVNYYQDILANAEAKRDAIWLPQDSTTVEEGVVLPMVLQQSWNRRLTVFSSSFGHVRRGVLFSLYPNNSGLGRNLANSALDYLADESLKRGVTALKDVQLAVNLRTARHLGLNFSSQQQNGFDLVFTGQ
jgi:putative ABC transport system substrate-binding protein